MIANIKADDKFINNLENFLIKVPYKSTGKAYEITRQWGNEYEVWLSEDFAKFLREFDHDCQISAEDGCSFCYYLFELGLIPEADYDPLDFIGETNE